VEFEPTVHYRPERDDVSSFDCGSTAQTNWLRRVAARAQEARTAAVYAATLAGTNLVVGYHAIAASSVNQADAPQSLLTGARMPAIPVILLARLGVDLSAQRAGLGKALLKDALLRAHEAASIIGARALLIHAESPEARAFYQHIAEFEESPTDSLHLILLMSDIDVLLR
jgi:GNAT superfamily N-acetyltransferase